MSDAFDSTISSGGGAVPEGPAPGTQLGKYKLLRLIGSGGMGNVWAAHDPDLDREIAIKLLRGAHGDEHMRTRLLREARAMARLKHPNVLTVYEVGTVGERDYIAMELVDGSSLDAWLEGKPSEPDVWDALLGAGRGLAAAHAAGLVHRDFKPHNVLRSRDGRVLVTDFGLARGLGEDVGPRPADALDTTAVPARMDSVLDSPLTRTGQLIGTPAYMAPEQFAGAPPDPRTDQFAFCVTAWQAFAGERPYRGATIDELRKGASGERPAAKLPPGVRAVLVRGLDPDPAKRWPDMPALLRALDGTRRTRLRPWHLILPGAALVTAGVMFFALRGGGTAKSVAPACTPGEQVIASAWSPARRPEVLAKQPKATPLLQPLDAYRSEWLATYSAACKLDEPRRAAKVGCLYGLRDQLEVYTELVTRFDGDDLRRGQLDLGDIVSPVTTCAADSPIAPPRLPDDAHRAPALALLAKTYGETVTAAPKVHEERKQLLDEARAIGWAPLVPRIEEQVGIASHAIRAYDDATTAFAHAAQLAREAHDARLEARARLDLLELARDAIVGVVPYHVYEDLSRDAELAVANAGNDPALLSRLDAAHAAHAAYIDHDLSAAIELDERAVNEASIVNARNAREAAVVDIADYLSVRAKPGDLDRAAQLLADVERGQDRHGMGMRTRRLVNALYWNAWLRGDLDAAHAVLDARGMGLLIRAAPVHGHVVDEAGHGVAKALVLTWQGSMFGDARRSFTDPTFAEMQVALTDDAGNFSIEVVPDGAVMAELGDRRSLPAVGKNGVTLVIAPTSSIHGRVDVGPDPAIGVEPFARIEISPATTWSVSTAPAADGSFTLAGIPRGAHARLGAVGSHWPRETGRRVDAGPAVDGAVIHWPVGYSFDVITKLARGSVTMLRGHVKVKTPAELAALTRGASDVAVVAVAPIGWANATSTGDASYVAGDTHAVIRDIAPGEITMCLATRDEILGCRQTAIDAQNNAPTHDGRRWFGANSAEMPDPMP